MINAYRKAWNKTPKARDSNRRYRRSDKWKAYLRVWNKTPKARASARDRGRRADAKRQHQAARRAYMRAYQRAWRRAWLQTSQGNAKNRLRGHMAYLERKLKAKLAKL